MGASRAARTTNPSGAPKFIPGFYLTRPLGHVSYCRHFSSVVCRPSSVRPSTFHILIFSSETTGPIATKLWWNGPWMAPFHSRWPLLLKIEISSNGQNCSILSQNVPKFELYKHKDELFNMYYRIFYEL